MRRDRVNRESGCRCESGQNLMHAVQTTYNMHRLNPCIYYALKTGPTDPKITQGLTDVVVNINQ